MKLYFDQCKNFHLSDFVLILKQCMEEYIFLSVRRNAQESEDTSSVNEFYSDVRVRYLSFLYCLVESQFSFLLKRNT